MNMDAFTVHMDTLYKAALLQARDENTARELVQETYLHVLQALSRGRVIDSPKAYLFSVLRNCFFMQLRRKYKFPTTYFGDLPKELSTETDFGGLERSQEAEAVRRELAFLSRIYREVMVRYYMKNESVEKIAAELSIPKGTVLSRLDVGRKKLKEGINNMKTYNENSFAPDTLSVGMDGRCGKNGEPFSCIKSLLDQNILLQAYEKPLTVFEIARALGTPMAFVEESVNKLADAQLMKRDGTKTATDFFIKKAEDVDRAFEIGKLFSRNTFDKVHPVILEMIKNYGEISGFSVLNYTQKYIFAVLSMRLSIHWRIYEAATGKETLAFNDYPDRPNYGKWILMGTRTPHAYKPNKEREKYNLSGRGGTDNINEHILSCCEWNSALGPIHWAKLKYDITSAERARLIDAVRTDTIDVFQAELLPDMERYGFIKNENNKLIPAVPYITRKDEKRFFDIEREAGEAFCNACLDKAINICNANVIPYPKRIPFAEEAAFGLPLDFLPMGYVYEAAARGLVEIKEGKCYPVMYLVVE
jgi:RNA polymerase sigma-70 factor (ECF subfamily)